MGKKTAFLLAVLVVFGASVMTGVAIAADPPTQAEIEAQQALVDEIQALLDANPGMTEDQAALQLAQAVADPAQKAAILQAAFSMIESPTQEQASAFTQAAVILNLDPVADPALTFNPAPVQEGDQDTTLTEETEEAEETGETEGDTTPPPPPVSVPAPTPTAGTGGAGGGSN